MTDRRHIVPSMALVMIVGFTGGCAQLIGIEDLPASEDAGAQPSDAGAQPPDAASPTSPDAAVDPRYRKQITIHASGVDAPGGGALEDFPVLFSVMEPEIAARASADGRDIFFTGADGVSRLVHEIEKWDPETGELVAWVKVPALSASTDTVLYIHYGGSEPPPLGSPAEVWSNGFVAVWHLAEDPGPGNPGEIRDSTTGNDGTAHSSMEPEDLVDGRIGDAIDFDGSNDEITFTNPITGATPHTISAWVNQRSTGSDDTLIVLGNGAQNQARWFNSVWNRDEVGVGFYANDWETRVDIEGAGWKLLHWTFSGSENRLYVDGVLAAGPRTLGSGISTQGSEGRMGNASGAFGTNMNLDGQIDEARIATVVRSPEWILTEHRNQSDPASFYAVGPESVASGP